MESEGCDRVCPGPLLGAGTLNVGVGPGLGAAGTVSRGEGAGASSPPWSYTSSSELQELGCIRLYTIQGSSHGIPAHELGLKAPAPSTCSLLLPHRWRGAGVLQQSDRGYMLQGVVLPWIWEQGTE